MTERDRCRQEGENSRRVDRGQRCGHCSSLEMQRKKEAQGGKGITLLQFVSINERVSAIDAHIKLGAAINQRKTESDAFVLDFTALAGCLNTLESLVRHGVELCAGNASGHTTRFFAAACNKVRSISFLSPRQGRALT